MKEEQDDPLQYVPKLYTCRLCGHKTVTGVDGLCEYCEFLRDKI